MPHTGTTQEYRFRYVLHRPVGVHVYQGDILEATVTNQKIDFADDGRSVAEIAQQGICKYVVVAQATAKCQISELDFRP